MQSITGQDGTQDWFRCNLLLEVPGWGHFPTGPLDAKSANIFILDSCILMQNVTRCVASQLVTQKHSDISINLETSFKRKKENMYFSLSCCLSLTVRAEVPPGAGCAESAQGGCAAQTARVCGARVLLGLWVHTGATERSPAREAGIHTGFARQCFRSCWSCCKRHVCPSGWGVGDGGGGVWAEGQQGADKHSSTLGGFLQATV